MTGLKTQESKEFVAFFKIVQAEALKENKIFFFRCRRWERYKSSWNIRGRFNGMANSYRYG